MRMNMEMKMLNGILTSAIVTLVSISYANASTGLEGKYKYVEAQCSSGAPVEMPAGTHISINGTLTVTSNKQKLEIYEVAHFDDVPESPLRQQLDLLESAKAYVQQQPDSPQKQKELEEIEKAEATIQKYFKEGISCHTTLKSSYSVVGSTLRTTDGVINSDCPGSDNGPVSSVESTFEISGKLLKIISPSDNDGSCPVGDGSVTIFERLN